MNTDEQTKLSASQALTATALSTNVYDLGAVIAMSNGEPMAVEITVETAADQGTGDEDYTFAVEFASDAAITTARQEVARRTYESGTPTAPAQNADLLVAGYKVVLPIPNASLDDVNQYVAVRYTLAGTSPSVTVSAFIKPMRSIEGYTTYSSGYTVN